MNVQPKYSTVERGCLYSTDYRIYFKENGRLISPWHDVPLFTDKNKETYNMIVEIPRWTNAKMEIATKEPLSPIRQDVKHGLPRFVENIFPFNGYIWNYGAMPQTWESPNHVDENTHAKGDNDPIDVIEIGSKIHAIGDVVQVKVLGILALIDEGETDWKVMTIDLSDPITDSLESLEDVEKYRPGLIKATLSWFRKYKIPAGKPPNKFGFDGNFKNAEYAKKIIHETHKFWRELIMGREKSELNTETHVPNAAVPASESRWKQIVDSTPKLGKPGIIPKSNEIWHFIPD
ncbi:hypothetical protein AB6A40_001431 [Gnathostoma spinigerum]|uniref:inorganic diphosphatase n=1 Tax=Gnathostoma spinigerum TaxID=75299 RepID=A0ABD6EDZ4_9BILA